MSSRLRNRHVWFGLLLGALGLVYIRSMSASGLAELPHIAAALTVLIPLTMFGVVLRSPWPSAAALVVLVFINITLT
ncbi:MAG: hypothetical protein EA345_05665 [Halomonas sp.]|nr:hypothetical protein [Halomonas sp.]TVP50080.1 MAG: hypothetical protein EA345_05665 [Halomonas sp.]